MPHLTSLLLAPSNTESQMLCASKIFAVMESVLSAGMLVNAGIATVPAAPTSSSGFFRSIRICVDLRKFVDAFLFPLHPARHGPEKVVTTIEMSRPTTNCTISTAKSILSVLGSPM
jgi:hypothetical protein